MSIFTHKKTLLASVITASMAPLWLMAGPLEEVVVTAQKREQNLQDVPMAITALGREFLQNNEINGIEDLTKLVPSLRFTPANNSKNNSIRIRGVGTDVFSIGVEPNVSVVVDDVPLARTSMANFEFADLERIEVLRGPQGTLFGKNASAGLVHVVTRDPAPEFEAMFRASYEQPQEYPGMVQKTQLGFSGPLTSSIGLRVTGFQKSIDGHLDDVLQNKNAPNADSFGVRSKLRWDPSDELVIRLSLEHQNVDAESFPLTLRSANPAKTEKLAPLLTPGEKNRKAMTFGNNRADSKSDALSLAINWNIGGLTLSSITGLRKNELFTNNDLPRLEGERVNVVVNGGPQEIETITQELRLSSSSGGAVEYTLGALWFDNTLDSDFTRRVEDIPATAAVPGAPPELTDILITMPGDSVSLFSTNRSSVATKNLGVFAQGTWYFSDKWNLTAGARYIDEELTGDSDRFNQTTHDSTGFVAGGSEFHISGVTMKDEAVTGTLSLQYELSEHSMIYTTLSTGYRGGAFDFASSNPEQAFQNPVDPEKATNYEIGIKSRLFDERIELNVTAFQTLFKDFQAQVVELGADSGAGSVSAGDFRLDNAGELQTLGVELEFRGRPVDALLVTGSFLYNEAEFKEFVTQCFIGQEPGENGGVDSDADGNCDYQDLAGGVLPNAPKYSASLTSRYEHNFDDYRQRVYAQISGRWQDDVQFNTEQHPLTIQKAYSIWDLRLGWKGFDDRMEIAGYVKNLFGQYYVSRIMPFSVENDRRDIIQFIPKESDRVFGVSFAYDF